MPDMIKLQEIAEEIDLLYCSNFLLEGIPDVDILEEIVKILTKLVEDKNE